MKLEFETRPTWCAFQWFFPLHLPVWSFVKGLKCWRVHCETVKGVSTGSSEVRLSRKAPPRAVLWRGNAGFEYFLSVSNWLICWFHIEGGGGASGGGGCSLAEKSVLGLRNAQKYMWDHSSVPVCFLSRQRHSTNVYHFPLFCHPIWTSQGKQIFKVLLQ